MTQFTAQVEWHRGNQVFLDNRYSRRHILRFDGGVEVPGSSSPHVVPLPMSDEAAVDPEEAYLTSISSCHMLWFLSMAIKNRFCVDHYFDEPIGIMEENAAGKVFVSVVTLRPKIRFVGERLPTHDQIEQMHHAAHEECFIANSIKTNVRCEPAFVD